MELLFAFWMTGALAGITALLTSMWRARRLQSLGTDLTDPAWKQSAGRIAGQLGLSTVPRLVCSNAIPVPMAGTIGGPTVYLPADAPQWDAEHRDVVLAHEMSHLVRNDPLRIVATRAACALYWFHPLMWIAARRSAADCEQACDESVLALGVRPSTYAGVLLSFADRNPAPLSGVTLPIVQRHRLESRLMSILATVSPHSLRPESRRRAGVSLVLAGTVVVTIAAAQPTRPVTVVAENSVALVPEPMEVVAPPAEDVATPEMKLMSAKPVATATVPAAMPAPVPNQSSSCWNRYAGERSFSGFFTQMESGRYLQRLGRAGREQVAQLTFGDLRVCMITAGFDGSENTIPSEWIGRADRVLIETEAGRDVRQLEVDGDRLTWTINGRSSAVDDGARAWRRAVLDLLDASWEAGRLRGQESTLRGEISTIHGERSTLLGEISTLRGHVSTLRGEISTLLGERSTLLGEISTIRGHESTLRGEISTARGMISTLESQRWERNSDRAAIDASIKRQQDRIFQIEDEIARYDADGRVRAVERRIDAHETDRRVAEVERQIREFDVERRVAEIQRQIDGLGVDRQVRSIEGEIRDLNVDERVRRIERDREEALDRLRSILGIR
jgi:beta-lactamase regulating signal transducer with metallopeptidase domain